MPAVHISSAAHGCEKTIIAVTLLAGKRSNPVKTSRPTTSLLPNCPGGVGRMKNMLKIMYPKMAAQKEMGNPIVQKASNAKRLSRVTAKQVSNTASMKVLGRFILEIRESTKLVAKTAILLA